MWNPIHLSEEKILRIFQCIRFVQRLCIVRFKVKVSSTSKRSTRGCVHSLPAHASIQRRAHVAQSEWWEVEYESKHISNFNWSFLLNCTVNLKLDWNIVFVRINVTKWGPICYLYFLILEFEYNSSTFSIYHSNIYIMRFQHLFKKCWISFPKCWISFFSVLNEFGKNVESSTAATGVEKHIGIW